jgi:hypothetical protein
MINHMLGSSGVGSLFMFIFIAQDQFWQVA